MGRDMADFKLEGKPGGGYDEIRRTRPTGLDDEAPRAGQAPTLR
jgi:hypothetical protein